MDALYRHMDPITRAAWRLVSKATCQAVYLVTSTLTIRRPPKARPDQATALLHLITGIPGQHHRYDRVLPSRLLAQCPQLRTLSCSDYEELRDLRGLPTGLEMLDLGGTACSLSPLPLCCPHLREPLFSHPRLADNPFLCLTGYYTPLAACTALQRLHLIGHGLLGRMEGSQLAALFRPLTGLTNLDLANSNLGDARAVTLIPVLSQLSGLRALGLRFNSMRGEAASALASAIEGGLSSLKQLDLSGNKMGPFGAALLETPSIKALTGLQLLSLSGVGNAGLLLRGAAAVTAWAMCGPTALLALDLSTNDIGPDGASTLAPALARLTALRRLRLSYNNLRAKGAEALAPALRCLTGLQVLLLGDNGLGHEGVAALAPAIGSLTALQLLNLGHNSLGAAGTALLAPELRQLTRLRKLHLHDNHLGVAGAIALAPALQRLTGLQRLYLFGNDLGGAGTAVLAPSIKRLPGLIQLFLDDVMQGEEGSTDVGDEGMDWGAEFRVDGLFSTLKWLSGTLWWYDGMDWSTACFPVIV